MAVCFWYFVKRVLSLQKSTLASLLTRYQNNAAMSTGHPLLKLIIKNNVHCTEQRTLIVTHSNQALNQLFEKIMALDVDERHLLRLGHGEEALETEKDFSR